MVLVLVLVVSASAGLGASLAIRRWPHADPALSATEALGEDLGSHRGSRRFLRSRMDPSTATGLALTVALAALVVTGVIVGVLAWMVRRNVGLVDLDHAIEVWADEHATTFSDAVLGAITHLGDTVTILGVGIVISLYGLWRWRKPVDPALRDDGCPRPGADLEHDQGRDRSRQARTASARHLHRDVLPERSHDRRRGDLSRGGPGARDRRARRGPARRSAGAAVAIAVAVGCTRVLLGVHWFSDVVAGLVIGWSWFGICAVAFGGRLLRFGSPAEAVIKPSSPGASVRETVPAERGARGSP